MGEFENIVSSAEFGIPDETVISKEIRILLDDGHKSEVEQKGHGLQRTTLLDLLKLLARNGKKYQDHPPPIFLIGEVESFLHPYAQKEIAWALSKNDNSWLLFNLFCLVWMIPILDRLLPLFRFSGIQAIFNSQFFTPYRFNH